MKSILFCLFFFSFAINISAQLPKLYVFSRETMPGNIPMRPNLPNADSVQPVLPVNKTYFIYVTVKRSTRISTGNIYLEGKYYQASSRRINSPVYIYKQQGVKSDDDKDLAVPKTNEAVYEILLREEITSAAAIRMIEKTAKQNAVMLTLRSGNKKMIVYSRSVKQLTAAERP